MSFVIMEGSKMFIPSVPPKAITPDFMISPEFFRKLPVPKDLKEQFPADERIVKIKKERDPEIRRIFEGKSDKLLLIIGPCSADREDAVLDYVTRLSKVL